MLEGDQKNRIHHFHHQSTVYHTETSMTEDNSRGKQDTSLSFLVAAGTCGRADVRGK